MRNDGEAIGGVKDLARVGKRQWGVRATAAAFAVLAMLAIGPVAQAPADADPPVLQPGTPLPRSSSTALITDVRVPVDSKFGWGRVAVASSNVVWDGYQRLGEITERQRARLLARRAAVTRLTRHAQSRTIAFHSSNRTGRVLEWRTRSKRSDGGVVAAVNRVVFMRYYPCPGKPRKRDALDGGCATQRVEPPAEVVQLTNHLDALVANTKKRSAQLRVSRCPIRPADGAIASSRVLSPPLPSPHQFFRYGGSAPKSKGSFAIAWSGIATFRTKHARWQVRFGKKRLQRLWKLRRAAARAPGPRRIAASPDGCSHLATFRFGRGHATDVIGWPTRWAFESRRPIMRGAGWRLLSYSKSIMRSEIARRSR